MKTILLLGSGMMAETVINYLLLNPNHRIHIASHILAESRKLAEKKGLDRCTFSEVKVEDAAELKKIVYTSDIVISYVPAFLHIHVAKACLELGRNLITASYIGKEMEQLHEQVKQRGLTFLNELGLDPGIDHMTTMKTLHEVEEQGGRVIEYESWCGGLPSPASCDNPLGYKFTWSPIGALRALKNRAAFIEGGKKVEILPQDLLYHRTTIHLNQALTLEGYPNRDSLTYKQVYNLKDAQKVLRGTLRYLGFVELISAFKEVGYFTEQAVTGSTWLEYSTFLLQKQEGKSIEEKVLQRAVLNVKHYSHLPKEEITKISQRVKSGFKFFGLLSNHKLHDPKLSNLQNLIKQIEPKLSLKDGETDLVAMQHRFIIEVNGKRYLRKSSLIEIGQKNGFSAMSLTVGLPTAMGAELLLQGRITQKGVIRPIYKDIYEPILKMLEKVDIKLVEVDEEL